MSTNTEIPSIGKFRATYFTPVCSSPVARSPANLSDLFSRESLANCAPLLPENLNTENALRNKENFNNPCCKFTRTPNPKEERVVGNVAWLDVMRTA